MVKSPRFLRPHTVVVLNDLGEENNIQVVSMTEVKFVSVTDASKRRGFGNTGDTVSDSILVVIDLNDYVSSKIYTDVFTDSNTQFTFRLEDKILYKGKEYEITSVNDLEGLKGPHFLEVTAA